MQPIEGKSFTALFSSRKTNRKVKTRDHILIGQERHDVGRPNDEGYPVRGIVKDGYLYLINYKTDRWPAGNPETGYLNSDGSPTKTLILDMNRKGTAKDLWDLNFGKRGEEELYNIVSDPECMVNLSGDPEYVALKFDLRNQLEIELREQNDPRILGKGDIFDKYPYAEEQNRDFFNRYVRGEVSRKSAGWVDSTDFETITVQ